jgi:uncharacterized alkaline shock family protein YloU
VPIDPSVLTPGRSLVSRRAIADIVRNATLGSYGVIGFVGGPPWSRIAELLGRPPRGLNVRIVDGLAIELDLVIGHNVPVAEVARQVDSAVRYAVRQALEREVDRLVIHVDGLRVAPAGIASDGGAERRRDGSAIAPDDLAGSGTDVA